MVNAGRRLEHGAGAQSPLLPTSDSLPFTIAQIAQDGKRNFGVVERDGAVGEDLFFLVALAGQQNDIARLGSLQRKANGGRAIRFHGVLRCRVAFSPGSISARIAARIFGARIVAGGDDEIAALARGLPHLRPLGAVAVAAAAEERDARACLILRGHLPRERSQIAQGVVGVRIVDDDGEGLAGIDGLEAAGNRLEMRNRGDES